MLTIFRRTNDWKACEKCIFFIQKIKNLTRHFPEPRTRKNNNRNANHSTTDLSLRKAKMIYNYSLTPKNTPKSSTTFFDGLAP